MEGQAPSFYEALGVDREATSAEIARGFKRAIRLWHPDLNATPQAMERTRELLAAWEVLRDPAWRAEYDASRSSVRSRANGNVRFVRRPSLLRRLQGWGRTCVGAAVGSVSDHRRRSGGHQRPRSRRRPRSPVL
jgi:DnaJ-class molecular chaperone